MASYTLKLVRGKPRIVAPYEQVYTVPVGGLSASSYITLPSSETYTGLELQVSCNGQAWTVGEDYHYAGSIPRTQITIVNALAAGTEIRFRIN